LTGREREIVAAIGFVAWIDEKRWPVAGQRFSSV